MGCEKDQGGKKALPMLLTAQPTLTADNCNRTNSLRTYLARLKITSKNKCSFAPNPIHVILLQLLNAVRSIENVVAPLPARTSLEVTSRGIPTQC
jgi:hypothetical protein